MTDWLFLTMEDSLNPKSMYFTKQQHEKLERMVGKVAYWLAFSGS